MNKSISDNDASERPKNTFEVQPQIPQQASQADKEWYEILKRSITESDGLPGWPSNHTQEVIVGKSDEAALLEAFRFFQKVRESSQRFAKDATILDFGVGWGRIIRCFYKDIPIENLHGVDVDPAMLAESARIGVKGDLRLISSTGTLPYENQSIDIGYAFSVFSHLSESAAAHWLAELMRVLKPGGTLVFTSTTLQFLDLCNACKLKISDRNIYEERYAAIFDNPASAINAYKQGQHVFAGVGGAAEILDKNEYGWASVPLEWVQKTLVHNAKSVEFTDDGSFDQGIFIITKM